MPKSSELWNDLTIKNDFIFTKVMRNQDICKEILEKILNIKIKKIIYLENEKTMDISLDSKSIRLDVYLEDEEQTIYNIEMQTSDTYELPKRSRYYQGVIDLNMIEEGVPYKSLGKSFIIFICTFDLFKSGRHIYTFRNQCIEDPSIMLEDGTTKIFINTKGIMNDIDPELKALLDYIDGKSPENNFTKRIDTEVKSIKNNENWRMEFMLLSIRDQDNYDKGARDCKQTFNLHLEGFTDDQIASELQIPIEDVKSFLDSE